jgi:hypothetical protein
MGPLIEEFVYQHLKGGQRLRADERTAVHKERRRAGNSEFEAILEVFRDLFAKAA